MKPPVRRMTLNRPDLAHCSPTTLHYTIPLTAKSANLPAEYRAKIAAAPYYPYTRLPMIQQPETKYTKCGDITIAYQVYGDRPIDLVLALGWVSNLDYFWEHPDCARFIKRFAKFARVLMFDRRGTGLSDRNMGTPTLEQRSDDIRAVMDACHSDQAAILGVSEGGNMASIFTATYPERTRAQILYGAKAKGTWAKDYPWGDTKEEVDEYLQYMEES